MRKFLAVVKREYLKLVWTKTFLLSTFLFPIVGLGFMFVPAILLSIEGEATSLAVVDQSGRLYEPLKNALTAKAKVEQPDAAEAMNQISGSQAEQAKRTAEMMKAQFELEEIKADANSLEQIKRDLNERLRAQKLDAYVVVPANLDDPTFELYARNTSDITLQSKLGSAINQAVRRVRMQDANINPEKLDGINRSVPLNTTRVSDAGESEDNGIGFFLAFGVGIMMMLILTIYGGQILNAVVEEKETRIAEILFSSARPFDLMMGKIVGVGLGALTQFAIWLGSIAAIAVFGVVQLKAAGLDIPLPAISPVFFVALFVFFILGFFTYATIYALIGSMVTNAQEGNQFALLGTAPLLISFYCTFPILRSPNSDFSTWMSIAPFMSALLMPVRMSVNMPPFWQVGLSVLLSLITIVGLTWLAARVYRIGMLMTGKKATIPEVWRWIRQS